MTDSVLLLLNRHRFKNLLAALLTGIFMAFVMLKFAPEASAATALPGGAVLCAQAETGICTLPPGTTATVYYGAGTNYLAQAGVTDSISCNQTTFGGDPDYDVVKACYAFITALPAGAVFCAGAESGTCNVPSVATVFYGAGSSYSFVSNVNGSINCNKYAFDGDPDYGAVKSCYALIPSAATAALPGGAAQCAVAETGTCSVPAGETATVYYGANNSYLSKPGVTGSIGCNQYGFGGDPDYGVVKSCYLAVTAGSTAALPSGAVLCAVGEAGTCILPAGTTATVYYGADGSYIYKQGVTTYIGCNQYAFGGDPDYGTVKSCYAVTAAAGGARAAQPVNLAPYYNVPALSTDTGKYNTAIYNQGAVTYTYSAATLGNTLTWNGSTFILGPPDVNDAVSNLTVPLPSGSFARLDILASRVYGSSPAENFTVTYTDGTTSTFTQGMSDWWTNANGAPDYPGESTAAFLPYLHNGGQGSSLQQAVSVFGYSFALNTAKTVKSVTLPPDGDVGVLAINLGISNAAPSIPAAGTAQAVLTHHNDTWRTGTNSGEYQLTPATVGNLVGSQVFGLLGTIPLDEAVHAQPLVVPNVSVAGDPNAGTHDVVYVATENNTVYAIDPVHLTILTQRNLGAAVNNPIGFGQGLAGIRSTPVIDTAAGAIYVVAYVQTAASGVQYQLHKLSLSNLSDMVPAVTVAPTATLNNGSTLAFNATYQVQRPALLETAGLIVVAFGSYGDLGANVARGWIVSYNATTLAFNTAGADLLDKESSAPGSIFLSSVWMSGEGPAVDESGNIYFATGNSAPGTYDGLTDIQESIVKMAPATGRVLSLFTPNDVYLLDYYDLDISSGGVMLFPSASTRVGANLSKDGTLRVFNRDNLGGNNDKNLVTTAYAGPCWCGLTYFNDGQDRLVSAGNNILRVYTWQNGNSPGLFLEGTGQLAGGQDPGSFTSVSQGGNSNSIIWMIPKPLVFGTGSDNLYLMAFQATPVNGSLPLLYMAPAGVWNYGGGGAAVLVPTVANGRVYVASTKQLAIFGFGGTR